MPAPIRTWPFKSICHIRLAAGFSKRPQARLTRGRRDVAVTWVQSVVRAAEQREILYDIDQVRRALFRDKGKDRDFDLLTKAHANLLRLWAEV